MKTYTLLGGAALAAVSLALPAQAQSLEAELGTGIIGLLENYDDGSFANIAVNSATIDASINASADQSALGGSLELNLQGSQSTTNATTNAANSATRTASSASADGDGGTAAAFETAASGATLDSTSTTDASSFAGSLKITVTPVDLRQNLGAVSTSAVGSVNAGDINIMTPETAAFELDGSATLSGSSADADATSASAEAFYGNLELDVDYAYQGIPDVAAMNIAYNEGFINGSVSMDGLGATSVATSAIGAANLGSITVGGPAPASEE